MISFVQVQKQDLTAMADVVNRGSGDPQSADFGGIFEQSLRRASEHDQTCNAKTAASEGDFSAQAPKTAKKQNGMMSEHMLAEDQSALEAGTQETEQSEESPMLLGMSMALFDLMGIGMQQTTDSEQPTQDVFIGSADCNGAETVLHITEAADSGLMSAQALQITQTEDVMPQMPNATLEDHTGLLASTRADAVGDAQSLRTYQAPRMTTPKEDESDFSAVMTANSKLTQGIGDPEAADAGKQVNVKQELREDSTVDIAMLGMRQGTMLKKNTETQGDAHANAAVTAHASIETHASNAGFNVKLPEASVDKVGAAQEIEKVMMPKEAGNILAETGTGMAVKAADVAASDIKPTEETAVVDKPVFQQISQRVAQELQEDNYVFDMKLFPEGLGKVEVRMLCEDGTLSLTVTAHNGEAGNLLLGQANELRAALSENYQVSELHIQMDGKTDTANLMFSDHGFGTAGQNGGGGNFSRPSQYYGKAEADLDGAFDMQMQHISGILDAKV